MEEICRLRIGGLSPAVSDKELKKRFKSFGELRAVRREEEGGAIIEIASSSAKLRNCVARYHHTKWKGRRLSFSVEGRGPNPEYGGSVDQLTTDERNLAGDSQSGKQPPKGKMKTTATRHHVTTPVIKRRRHTPDGLQLQTNCLCSNGEREGKGGGDGSISDEGVLSSGEGQRSSDDEREDEVSRQLQEEKTKALSILDSVLAAPSTPARDSRTDSDQQDTENGDRLLSVRSDLKDLFGQADGPYTFDFQHSDVESEADAAVFPLPQTPTHHQEPATEHVHKKPPKLFFFHSGNDRLRNRLHENRFYRSHPLEKLEEGWSERRAVMRQAYKARHKDAVRMARKAKSHRPRPN